MPTATCDTDDEYFLEAPSTTSPGRCGPAKSCGYEEYAASPPTGTNDRVCEKCSQCAKGQYAATECAGSNDRQCVNFTVCGGDQYELKPPGDNSDRECRRKATTCGSDQYIKLLATATSDIDCRSLTICKPGEEASLDPTDTSDRQCQPCEQGATFSTSFNSPRCTPCSNKCGAGQRRTKICTATADIVCELCPPGSYSRAERPGAMVTVCQPWSDSCPGGTFQVRGPNSAEDRKCMPCLSGTFRAATDVINGGCKAHQQCRAGEVERPNSATPFSDRECDPAPSTTTTTTTTAKTTPTVAITTTAILGNSGSSVDGLESSTPARGLGRTRVVDQTTKAAQNSEAPEDDPGNSIDVYLIVAIVVLVLITCIIMLTGAFRRRKTADLQEMVVSEPAVTQIPIIPSSLAPAPGTGTQTGLAQAAAEFDAGLRSARAAGVPLPDARARPLSTQLYELAEKSIMGHKPIWDALGGPGWYLYSGFPVAPHAYCIKTSKLHVISAFRAMNLGAVVGVAAFCCCGLLFCGLCSESTPARLIAQYVHRSFAGDGNGGEVRMSSVGCN